MTSSSLTYRPQLLSRDFAPSYATSEEARNIGEQIHDFFERACRSSSRNSFAKEELEDAFFESRYPGWDGYGAHPVEGTAYLRAREFLGRILTRFPAPTASASPHGTLTLEWVESPRRRFIVSIGPDEQIAYAGVFGSESVQGVASFVRDIPQDVTRQLARLFYLA